LLKYIDCSYLLFRNQNRTVYYSYSLQTFHQNTRGLRNQNVELISSLEIDNIKPHVLHFSDHRMEQHDLLHLTLLDYVLGSSLCRQKLLNGGMCIFVREVMRFRKMIISHSCKKQDLEICGWRGTKEKCIYFTISYVTTLFISSLLSLLSEICHDHHHHHKHQGLDPLIPSVSRVTAARANVSSVFQLFSFLVVCSGMILKGFGSVAFFASVKASSVCIHLPC